MNIEKYGESLQMAVDEMFHIQPERVNEIEEAIEDVSRSCLEHLLMLARLNQQPGLRQEVAVALTDPKMAVDDREKVFLQAYHQGETATIRNSARKKYQEIVKSEQRRNY